MSSCFTAWRNCWISVPRWVMRSVVSFFFQAEDGIRDGHVTGVQTCALLLGPEVRRHSGKTTRSDRLVQIGTRIRNQLRALAMCIRVKRKARLLVHGECDLQLTRTYLSACSCSHRFSS